MFSRRHLKWGLLACLGVLAATVILQLETAFGLWVRDALYFVGTGSAAGAIAICLALVATV